MPSVVIILFENPIFFNSLPFYYLDCKEFLNIHILSKVTESLGVNRSKMENIKRVQIKDALMPKPSLFGYVFKIHDFMMHIIG